MSKIAGLTPLYELPYYMHKRRICNSEGHSWDPRGENIQLAIDDLLDVGGIFPGKIGKVWLPPASYEDPLIISDTLEIHGALCIMGCGMGTTWIKLADNVNDDMVRWRKNVQENFFVMKDLGLWGNRDEQVSGHGIRIDGGLGQDLVDVHLVNIIIWRVEERGIYTDETWGHMYTNIIIEWCGDHGLGAYGGTQLKVTSSNISSNGGFGLSVASALSAEIVSCSILDNGEYGVNLGASSKLANCNIQNNSQKTVNTYDGVLLNANSHRAVIADNYIDGVDSQRYGINVPANALDVKIANNVIRRNVTADINDAGTRTRINGLGREASGGGAPVAANWSIGDIVQDTDNPANHWIKDYDGNMRQIA